MPRGAVPSQGAYQGSHRLNAPQADFYLALLPRSHMASRQNKRDKGGRYDIVPRRWITWLSQHSEHLTRPLPLALETSKTTLPHFPHHLFSVFSQHQSLIYIQAPPGTVNWTPLPGH